MPVTSGSGSGPGADQHLLALLRAIRLRQAAPDAVAAGIADTSAALAHDHDDTAPPALPPGEGHAALPPGTPRLGLPPAPGDEETEGRQLRPRWAHPEPASPGSAAPGDPAASASGSAASADLGTPLSSGGPGAGPRTFLSGGPSAGGMPQASPAGDADRPGAQPSPGRSFWSRSPVRPTVTRPTSGSPGAGPGAPAGANAAGDRPASHRLGGLGGGPGPAQGPGRGGLGDEARRGDGTPGAEHGPLLRPAGLPPVEGGRSPAGIRPGDNSGSAGARPGDSGRGGGGPGGDPARVDPPGGAGAGHGSSPGAFSGGADPVRGSAGAARPGSTERGRELARTDLPRDVEPMPPGPGPSPAGARRGPVDRLPSGSAGADPDGVDRHPGPAGGDPYPGAGDTDRHPGTGDARYADVEAVGRPSRNRFAGLPVRRPPVPGPVPAVPPSAPGPAASAHEPAPDALGRPAWAAGGDGGRQAGGRDGTPHRTPPSPRLPGFDLPHVMPPMVTARPGNADGMDPADDALLRQTQRLLSTSLTFAGGPGEVAERLRAALLQAQPALLAALPGGPVTQTDQLARALVWLVHHLDRPPLLVDGCGRLGAALATCGVEPGQLQLVGAALAEAMRAGMAPGQWRQDFDLAWRSTWQHAYEWIVHGGATAAHHPPTWGATVVGHDVRRPDLAVVRLRPHLPMPWRPGQYARVQVAGLPAIWRPYSLAGAPRRDDVLELHVRAKTHNGVSGTLVYGTAVGDEMRLSRAEGAMVLPPAPGRDLLMIAGDTGVAPFKALLTELADTADARSAVLFWGVRDLDELYDIDELAAIARSAQRATVVPVVAQGDPGPYASGLVTDAVAAYGEWSDHEVYLAGPPLMLSATSAALRQLGVAPERIHHDAPG